MIHYKQFIIKKCLNYSRINVMFRILIIEAEYLAGNAADHNVYTHGSNCLV